MSGSGNLSRMLKGKGSKMKNQDKFKEEEKPLPCPFCGRDVEVHLDAPEEWVSCQCGYSSKMGNCAIANHNRVARAVIEAKKEIPNG